MILMSNNQWKCDRNNDFWRERGEDCSAEARVPGMARAYLEVMPDILGLQEVSNRQAEILMDNMRHVKLDDGTEASYEYLSGRDTPIVYRRDKLKLLESGFFLYSTEVPGFEGSFNNSETKSWCWGVFEDRKDGKRLALMSTHLWWRSGNPASSSYQAGSDEARAYQIGLACREMDGIIEKYGCPAVLMGDLNATVSSPCLKTAFDLGWSETHDIATGDRNENRGHHPCGTKGWKRDTGGTFEQAIDHILIKNAGDAEVKYFRRLTPEYFDPLSDHYPLYIDLRFN